MTSTHTLRVLAAALLAALLCASACKRERPSHPSSTGVGAKATPRRGSTPMPTKPRPTLAPGQPTPLPEIPG